MFPAQSPNSQALFQQLASGGATPSTLDFHRTALNMASARKSDPTFGSQTNVTTSQPQESPVSTVDVDSRPQRQSPEASGPQTASNTNDPFGSHDANDAANGLFLLAQARNGSQGHNKYTMERPAGPTAVTTAAGPSSSIPAPIKVQDTGEQQQGPSPTTTKRPARPTVRGSLSGSITGMSEMSGEFSESGAEEVKPNTRNKGKKGTTTAKGGQAGPGRRKAEDTPSKPPANKRSKSGAGNTMAAAPQSESGDDAVMMNTEMLNENGKKMTDEEKRRNFLERNR